MAVLEHEVRSAEGNVIGGLHRRLYTREEYYALAKAGVINEERVELIEGELIEMAPIGQSHASIYDILTELLRNAFGPGFRVRGQIPISLGEEFKPSDPHPDITVAVGNWRDFLSHHPTPSEIKLLVEISETSLVYDRTVKAALFAGSSIPEYWIVDIVSRQLEVYRNPVDGHYVDMEIFTVGQVVEPLHATNENIAIKDFMP